MIIDVRFIVTFEGLLTDEGMREPHGVTEIFYISI